MPSVEGFFLADAKGRGRFCLHHAPAAVQGRADGNGADPPARAVVVFLPPWADEMNKSRRMVRLQAELLARNGLAVCQVDLTGCGDSHGEHGDADWEQWVNDGLDAVRWLGARYPGWPVVLWGLRSGCLLACDVAARLDEPVSLLCWNPPASGRVLWQQFLRLATAAALTGEAGKARADAVKQALQNGQPVEIAGYEVSSALAKGLEASTLKVPSRLRAAAVLETGVQAGDELSPAVAALVQAWRGQGHEVLARRVQGPAFWQTTEIEDADQLLPATLQALVQMQAVEAAPLA